MELYRAPAAGGNLNAEIIRNGKPATLSLKLEKGWRQLDDISWRSSAWGLRRMGTAGMKLEQLEGERPAGVPKEGMALLVKHMGMFGGPHGAAKAAGVQLNDVVISFDGQTDLLRENRCVCTRSPQEQTGRQSDNQGGACREGSRDRDPDAGLRFTERLGVLR